MQVRLADADGVRAFHRQFATGVTVVTTMEDDVPRGLVVNAFSSLTLEPPRVLVCVSRSAQSYQAMFRTDVFAVNVLAADQEAVARTFARSGGEKFADVEWEAGEMGAPILTGCCGVAETKLETRVHVDTHTIFVGRVVDVRVTERSPLLYWGGRFWDPEQLRPLG
jgi:flavin reductase (DIM6/NTAB) family NADH-FMN oxidoreductase RutF